MDAPLRDVALLCDSLSLLLLTRLFLHLLCFHPLPLPPALVSVRLPGFPFIYLAPHFTALSLSLGEYLDGRFILALIS